MSTTCTINLRVWLKIPDAEAATVKNTLVRRMGFAEVLVDVKKERLFSIVVDSGDPEKLAKSFAKELVNENKESHKVLFDELTFEFGYIPVKVALHIEDGEAISTRDRLRNRLGFENVVDVKKATVWKLYLKGENQEQVAKEIAEGLLINPHKDSYEVLRMPKLAA
jgi:phosphoribosylformylglycinamidine (FGAM) synthase PurS component